MPAPAQAADGPTPLDGEIRRRIAQSGPIPVREFMELCLYDPKYGYYNRRAPFGAAGDFITAPEISQMFGELIGLWAATVWRLMGAPARVLLIELGPGRGTLMSDALRAIRAAPDFRQAVRGHLVESSPDMQFRQRGALTHVEDVPLHWHATLDEVPDGPAIILANEFFDAQPIRQVVRGPTGWHERMVGINGGGELALTESPQPLRDVERSLPSAVQRAARGEIFEWRPDGFAAAVARRVARAGDHGGAALIIDYGHEKSATGDTFQAVRSHRYASPLALPGHTDLTAHVDFEALASDAETAGAKVHGPIEQGTFLKRLGIVERAAALSKTATEEQRAANASALERLTAAGPAHMGAIFKAIGLAAPDLERLPGFQP